jgi:hypothetical protein
MRRPSEMYFFSSRQDCGRLVSNLSLGVKGR